MLVSITAVGRIKSGPESDLADRYRKRFEATGRSIGLGVLKIVELSEARDATAKLRKQDEATRVLARTSIDAIIVAMDERGRSLSSEAFADLIARHRDDGAAEMTFLVGGPDGHGSNVLNTAHDKISLGRMTMPHGLARVVLLEQLYRATTILSGHPYHRA
jgi:23S rRNA (pseudouridine1915-N3)-methyltransferase